MELGDFFARAPFAAPVNPRPVKFTAICRDEVLPGGTPNPTKRPVRATCTGCFVFMGAEEMAEARRDARIAVRERYALAVKKSQPKDGPQQAPVPPDDADVGLELMYQQLQRVLWKFDKDSQRAIEPLFPDVKLLRQLVLIPEADRLLKKYDEYVKSEHPEVVDDETFRGAEG